MTRVEDLHGLTLKEKIDRLLNENAVVSSKTVTTIEKSNGQIARAIHRKSHHKIVHRH